jgi:hypothetical protein
MTNVAIPKIKASTASEICERFNPPKEARALLQEGMNPGEFADALIAKKQYVTGIDFLAHALPPREGIWWGCLCLQSAAGDEMEPSDKEAATAAVRWVLAPGDQHRVAARPAAEAIGLKTAAGALAAAVTQTGSAEGQPKPAPFAAAKTVALAVKLATIQGDPARILDRQKAFVDLALEIAAGRHM